MRRKDNAKGLKPQNGGKRLRKQPRMQRVKAAHVVAMPKQGVPKTVRRRRRRNTVQPISATMQLLAKLVFTSRWISLGLLGLTGWALYFVGMNPAFYLTTLPVEGIWSVPATEVVAASGLGGAHAFAVDPAAAAERITAVPGVISATVTLNWPNQVLIEVAEDTPIAVWREAGAAYWVTETGEMIPARGGGLGLLEIESEVALLPAATADVAVTEDAVEAADEAMAGETAVSTAGKFVPADVLAGALQLKSLRPNIDRLLYRPAGGLSYEDGRGWRAYFGVGTDMAQKLVVYEAIVDDLLARGLAPVYISVSNQTKPYYRAQ